MVAEVAYMDAITSAYDSFSTIPSCTCENCQNMCRRPCWPLPHEAARMIAAGHADMMTDDYYTLYDDKLSEELSQDAIEVRVLRPGKEFTSTKEDDVWCKFHDRVTKMCKLHEAGLKPFEGRTAIHSGGLPKRVKRSPGGLRPRDKITLAWHTLSGRRVIELWKRKVTKG